MTAREKLNQLKQIWGLRTDKELAKFIGTSKANIDSWVKRDKIPDKWILIIEDMKPLTIDHINNQGNYIKSIKSNEGYIVQDKHTSYSSQTTQDNPRAKTLLDKFNTLSEIGKAEAENCINTIYLKELKENTK